jgi:catechol 2,3-dioxygenase-like lactoylglutathione lyase family enzyme
VKLDGIHHVTCITADAPRNVDFYTRVLGLRMVKKTVSRQGAAIPAWASMIPRGSGWSWNCSPAPMGRW